MRRYRGERRLVITFYEGSALRVLPLAGEGTEAPTRNELTLAAWSYKWSNVTSSPDDWNIGIFRKPKDMYL